MTDEDRRDIINHVFHFGNASVVRRDKSGKWWIDFRGFGFPSPFKTKSEAMERVSLWVHMLYAERQKAA